MASLAYPGLVHDQRRSSGPFGTVYLSSRRGRRGRLLVKIKVDKHSWRAGSFTVAQGIHATMHRVFGVHAPGVSADRYETRGSSSSSSPTSGSSSGSGSGSGSDSDSSSESDSLSGAGTGTGPGTSPLANPALHQLKHADATSGPEVHPVPLNAWTATQVPPHSTAALARRLCPTRKARDLGIEDGIVATAATRRAAVRHSMALDPVWEWCPRDPFAQVLTVLCVLGLTPVDTFPGNVSGAEVPLWSPTFRFATFMDLVATNDARDCWVVVEFKRNCGRADTGAPKDRDARFDNDCKPRTWRLPTVTGETVDVARTRFTTGCVQAWFASLALIVDYGLPADRVGWLAIELTAGGDPVVTFGGCVATSAGFHPPEVIRLGYGPAQLRRVVAMVQAAANKAAFEGNGRGGGGGGGGGGELAPRRF